jgi:hypothetical protein
MLLSGQCGAQKRVENNFGKVMNKITLVEIDF